MEKERSANRLFLKGMAAGAMIIAPHMSYSSSTLNTGHHSSENSTSIVQEMEGSLQVVDTIDVSWVGLDLPDNLETIAISELMEANEDFSHMVDVYKTIAKSLVAGSEGEVVPPDDLRIVVYVSEDKTNPNVSVSNFSFVLENEVTGKAWIVDPVDSTESKILGLPVTDQGGKFGIAVVNGEAGQQHVGVFIAEGKIGGVLALENGEYKYIDNNLGSYGDRVNKSISFPPFPREPLLITAEPSLNVRSLPNGSVIGTLPEGKNELSIIDTDETGNWLLAYGDFGGREHLGWFSAEFVVLEKPLVNSVENTFNTSLGAEIKIIANLPYGELDITDPNIKEELYTLPGIAVFNDYWVGEDGVARYVHLPILPGSDLSPHTPEYLMGGANENAFKVVTLQIPVNGESRNVELVVTVNEQPNCVLNTINVQDVKFGPNIHPVLASEVIKHELTQGKSIIIGMFPTIDTPSMRANCPVLVESAITHPELLFPSALFFSS